MTTQSHQEKTSIPHQIKEQLFVLGKNEVWCWGSHGWIGTDSTLIFNIQNCHQIKKGVIHITLNNQDLYDIKIFNENYNLFSECNDIYCDLLVNTIHKMID